MYLKCSLQIGGHRGYYILEKYFDEKKIALVWYAYFRTNLFIVFTVSPSDWVYDIGKNRCKF